MSKRLNPNEKIKELAEKHWEWLEPVLKLLGVRERTLEIMKYLYVTAFVHGYKHKVESEL